MAVTAPCCISRYSVEARLQAVQCPITDPLTEHIDRAWALRPQTIHCLEYLVVDNPDASLNVNGDHFPFVTGLDLMPYVPPRKYPCLGRRSLPSDVLEQRAWLPVYLFLL